MQVGEFSFNIAKRIIFSMIVSFRPGILLVSFLLFFFSCLSAQTPNIKFKHISNNDGLSQNSVTAIMQDYMGFMWFGTYDGLNKYDGHNFIVYKSIPGKKESLVNNSINVLFEDSKKNIWIGTHHGVCRYNRELDCFASIEGLSTTYVNGIFELDDGTICFITYVDFIVYYPDKDSFVSIYNNGVHLRYDLFTGGVLQYSDSTYLLTSKKGLHSFNAKTFLFNEIEIKNSPYNNKLNIETIYKDSYDNIWIGTFEKGLFLLDSNSDGEFYFVNNEKDFFLNRGFTAKNVEVFEEDNYRNLWIGTESGVFLVDLDNFENRKIQFHNLKHEPGNIYSLPNSSIKAIYEDDAGTLWVGSYASGMSYYNNLFFKFHVLQYNNEITGINHNQVSYILGEEKNFWIGTENGLNKYDRENKIWTYYTHDPADTKSIGSNIITLIFRDSKRNLWVGTWAGGLNLLDEKTDTFIRYVHDESDSLSISSNNVFGLAEDNRGRLWVGTMGGGVNRFDYELNGFITYESNSGENSFTSDWVKNIIKDTYGNVWFATGFGLNVYNVKNDSIYHYFNDTADSSSLCSNSMVLVFEDAKGTIWAGTENGLSRYNAQSKNFTNFREDNGLPNNVIRSICDDDNGDLWIGTNKGLTRYVNGVSGNDSLFFVSYGTDDGLQGNEFNSRSCFKDENGVLYFGGTNGMNSFHPDSIRENTIPPKIVFTDFLIFNKSVKIKENGSPLKKHINLTDTIVLNYDQTVITFKYAALNFIAPEKNVYKYMLKGFDENWNDVGHKTEATYTNLNPGDYEFVVIGANNDGVWNYKGASLLITIRPPWWQTILFKIAASVLLLGSAVGFYYVRIYQLEKQKNILQKEVDERTAEIKEKNRDLEQRTSDLNEANAQLEDRQRRVLEQAEKLREQTEELRKKNDDLSVLNSTKDKFFSIIAHDLKNPFSAVMSFSQLIKDKYDRYDDEKRKQLIGIISDSANSYYKLLENLLEWSRSQTGNIQFMPEKFVFNEIIEEIQLLLKNSMEEKELDLNVIIDNKFCVYGDKNMMKTIFRNIITNAIKFSEKGTITVIATKENDTVNVKVIDQGVGMSEGVARALFTVEKSRNTAGTRGERGTGLGLVICKDFVDYHGGSISASSTIGKGSVFTVIFPAVEC